MPKVSAGILLYRVRGGQPEFLLVHPGGPFFKNKHAGVWTIPKGEPASGEEPLSAAVREFQEELGGQPSGNFIALSPVRQKGGKFVHAWALEGDFDPDKLKSNTFSIEWPPRSGRRQEFPEVDEAGFFALENAREKLNPAQIPLLEELVAKLGF